MNKIKKVISVLISGYMALFSFGCEAELPEQSMEHSESTESIQREDISETVSEIDIEEEMKEEFPFLESDYVVVSKRESFGTVYVCEYYFVNGTVSGAKSSIDFSTVELAEEYYETIVADYPYARIKEMTVINYLEDDEDFYYGYSLEKLKFVLEKADYEIEIKFDEDAFYEEFVTDSEN